MEEDQQIMEYYLPPEDELDRVQYAFEHAVGEDSVRQINSINAENGSDSRLDEVFPVGDACAISG